MKSFCHALAICLVFVAAPGISSAQEEGIPGVMARLVSVKPDRVAQWEGLMKERTEALQATGQGFRHVFQRVRGPLSSFVIFTPGGGANVPVTENWVNALNGTVASSELHALQPYGDAFTLDLGGDVSIRGDYMYVRVRTVPPGRSNDYYEWQRDELIPALREANVGDVRTLRIAQGGNINTWLRFSYSDEMPLIGGTNPVAQSMGERQFQQMLARGDAMTSSATDFVYRYRADLSYDAN